MRKRKRLAGWIRAYSARLQDRGRWRSMGSRFRRNLAATFFAEGSETEAQRQFMEGQAWHYLGHVDRAKAILETLIEGERSMPRPHAHLEIANILVADGDESIALGHLEQAAIDPILVEEAADIRGSFCCFVGTLLIEFGAGEAGSGILERGIRELLPLSKSALARAGLLLYFPALRKSLESSSRPFVQRDLEDELRRTWPDVAAELNTATRQP